MGDTKFRQTHRRTARGPYRSDEQARKRAEAEARNAAWAGLSTKDKLLSLRERRGSSKKQLTKLLQTEVLSKIIFRSST